VNSERLFTLVAQIQAEVGQRPSGNGSLTLHFQNGRVQAVEMTTHTRVTAALLDSPPLKR
jgi:hypothetical protein